MKIRSLQEINSAKIQKWMKNATNGYVKVKISEVRKKRREEKKKSLTLRRKICGTKRFHIFNKRYLGDSQNPYRQFQTILAGTETKIETMICPFVSKMLRLDEIQKIKHFFQK